MEHFVGIDVAKDRLDVHIPPGAKPLPSRAKGKGLAMLVERLQALAPVLVTLEATGGYETVVASYRRRAAAAGDGQPTPDPRLLPALPPSWPRLIGSRPPRSPILPRHCGQRVGQSPPMLASVPSVGKATLRTLVAEPQDRG